ncbi:MAG: carbamoyltransferase [Gammaproteobacteria bacterium]|jgi:carbamoyltransferase|nr:carbamoyltransferase [Gammaproteobacteria bacterium]NCF59907.1 carbamoyltransferase [Gammaproteobacteria bacterium]
MVTTSKPWVLGLSASHNGAACLLHGDRIVAAVQEERLVGKKRARLYGSRPSLAVQYCLAQGGIAAADLDMVVICAQSALNLPENDLAANRMLNVTANGTPTLAISHHAGHAISAFATSGFDDAAVLVVDGMGSPTSDLSDDEKNAVIDTCVAGGETNSIYHAESTTLKALEKHMIDQGRWLDAPPPGSAMPGFGSLGGLFSAAAQQIFGDSMDAGKVMGLAPYGSPTINPEEFFEIRDGRFVFLDEVQKRFTATDRWPEHKNTYKDLAASVQNALEHALLYLVGRVRELSASRNLVYAGGVALNSVANERIIRETDFDRVYVIPAAEDSGPAIGAAYHGLWHLTGEYTPQAYERDAFGAVYGDREIEAAIASTPAIETRETANCVRDAADLLVDGRIIAWFSGPSELGPRALGQRSILCDPRQPDAKEKLNARVKHREGFRPFAPVIPLEETANWFDVAGVEPASPFMLRVMAFKDAKRDLVPAVVHVDGTGRVQTVTRAVNGPYYDLVREFGERTGVPILLNTSLNVMGEPIVETPEDALWCLLLTQLDACVFDGAIVTKRPGYGSLRDLCPYFLVGPGDIRRPPSGDGLLFAVTTPWGPYVFGLRDAHTIAVLDLLLGGLMDGNTRAEAIFEQLRSRRGDFTETFLIRLFAQLRRWRVISFRDAG